MKTPQFTTDPEQWKTIVRHNPFQADYVIDSGIGLIKPPLSMPRAEIEANARLIAQAPAMYEALQECLKEMDAFQAYWTSPNMGLKRGECKAQEMTRLILNTINGKE